MRYWFRPYLYLEKLSDARQPSITIRHNHHRHFASIGGVSVDNTSIAWPGWILQPLYRLQHERMTVQPLFRVSPFSQIAPCHRNSTTCSHRNWKPCLKVRTWSLPDDHSWHVPDRQHDKQWGHCTNERTSLWSSPVVMKSSQLWILPERKQPKTQSSCLCPHYA